MSEKQYRELGPNEVIQEGDEKSLLYSKLGWHFVNQMDIGWTAGDPSFAGITFRRLIPTPTPTPPDLEKYREAQQEAERQITNMNKAQTIDFVASHVIELYQLRAENERLKKERDEAISAYNVRNDEVTGLIGMLEEARAALSGSTGLVDKHERAHTRQRRQTE